MNDMPLLRPQLQRLQEIDNPMDVDVPDDSVLSQHEAALLENLDKKLDEIEYNTCEGCLEEGFNLGLDGAMCSRCRHDTESPVRKWSAANKVHPGKPPCLKGLTDMEEMLISRVKSYTQVRWVKQQHPSYQEQIIRWDRHSHYPQRGH